MPSVPSSLRTSMNLPAKVRAVAEGAYEPLDKHCYIAALMTCPVFLHHLTPVPFWL